MFVADKIPLRYHFTWSGNTQKPFCIGRSNVLDIPSAKYQWQLKEVVYVQYPILFVLWKLDFESWEKAIPILQNQTAQLHSLDQVQQYSQLYLMHEAQKQHHFFLSCQQKK